MVDRCLKMPQVRNARLIILYISEGFEYATGIKHARVLNMPRYIYNNITIIAAYAIIFECFLLHLNIQALRS